MPFQIKQASTAWFVESNSLIGDGLFTPPDPPSPEQGHLVYDPDEA